MKMFKKMINFIYKNLHFILIFLFIWNVIEHYRLKAEIKAIESNIDLIKAHGKRYSAEDAKADFKEVYKILAELQK